MEGFTALVVGFFALISGGAQVALDAKCQNTHAPSSMSLRRCCRSLRRDLHGLNKRFITLDSRTLVETDTSGIPLKPTWSVHNLVSSYPKPTISSANFKRLHELSALHPPPEGTSEHEERKQELEDLVTLVEAVKLVDLEIGRAHV